MADEEHLARLKQGVAAWNAWQARNPTIQPNLSGAHLNGIDLHGAYLDGADLHGAFLGGALFEGSRLNRALLRGALLIGALFREADLDEADFHEAIMGLTILGDVDLSRVRGLDTV